MSDTPSRSLTDPALLDEMVERVVADDGVNGLLVDGEQGPWPGTPEFFEEAREVARAVLVSALGEDVEAVREPLVEEEILDRPILGAGLRSRSSGDDETFDRPHLRLI